MTVSNGVVGGSSGQPNSQDVPITVGQLIGSSTSSDGAVVPVTTIPVPVYSGAQSNGVPQLGPVTASNRVVVGSSSQSNGQIVPVTAGQIVGSSTLSVGAVVPAAQTPAIAEYSTKSDGSAVLISAAAGPTSLVSNGQIAPTASENAASGQLPWVSENGGAAASNALQSGSIAAPVVTQSGSSIVSGPTVTPAPVQPQIYPSDNKGPFTQQPIGSNSMTAVVIPTSIIYEPSTQPSIQPTSIGPTTGLPSNIPLILYPTSGPVVQPSHTDLIQIGFNYSLNYPFVYNNTDSQAQIFHYIPLGICYGLEIDVKQITMQSLRAWDTSQDLHYITTLALAWIPQGLVDDLSLLVSTSSSRFYNNTDSSTRTIISMVNNAIPITGSNTTDGSNDNSVGDNPTSTGTVKSNGAPIGGDIGKSSPVRASSVGIGVGVACGAAVYGAAMFFVARRYKKRRQSHVRSPSMFSSPVMSHTGPDAGAGAALMSGAMGERSASPYNDNDGRAGSRGSGRSGSSRHQISAPVMAENSLGWN